MTASLKSRLARRPILLVPGVFDPLTALIASTAGAEALYLSGAGIAYTRLGRPDIGLVSVSEVAETIALIRDRVVTPVIVDADNGYGNALNMHRTMRMFERAGANALQIEDQSYPKRCGHLAEKRLVSSSEMVGKIKAALDARTDAGTLIIARTDAIAVEGFDAAIERAARYAEAGADALFVEAPNSLAQLTEIVKSLGSRCPLLANMVEGGKTPLKSASELEAMGFSLAIFPGGIVRALARTAGSFYETLLRDGTTAAFQPQMYSFDELNAVIGAPQLIALGKRFDGEGA
jgi:2-methylisocitrate lyase-like PEP mutase family enzyme